MVDFGITLKELRQQAGLTQKQLAERLAVVVKSMVDREVKEEMARIIGPAPASIGKINDIFRFVFYVKHGKYDKLIQIKDVLEQECKFVQTGAESVQFDFDPMNTM